jgi:tetratricopeptide (TPR) repeat protein
MANQRKQVPQSVKKEPLLNLILTGLICLGVGLGVGYYFGRQSGEALATASFAPAAAESTLPSGAQGAVQDPALFVQNEANLKALLAADPKNLSALIRLGNLYYDHQRYQQAVDWYGKALEIDPRNPNVRTDRGTSYWNLNQPDAAIDEFNRSLEVDPGHAQTLYNLGVVYLHGKKDPQEAKKAWQRLLAANPNYPDRANVERQLAALPASVPTAVPPAGQKKPGSPSMEDLLDRMKSRP